MKKTGVLLFSAVLLVSTGSAAVIPSNISIDLNIDIFDDNQQKQEKEEKENNTYGERVGGQALHTDTGPNDPEPQRNSEEYGITEEDTNEKNDFGEMISAFLHNLFGTGDAPDTGEPNSVT